MIYFEPSKSGDPLRSKRKRLFVELKNRLAMLERCLRLNLATLLICCPLLAEDSPIFKGEIVSISPTQSGIKDTSLLRQAEEHSIRNNAHLTTYGRFQIDQIPFVQQSSSLNGNSDFAQIRGTNSFSRTLIMNNGVPLNFRNGLGPTTLLLTPESTSSIRIYRGPGTMLFGSDAMGGTLNYVSSQKPKDAIFTQVGSFGERAFGAITHQEVPSGYINVSGFQESIKGDYTYEETRTGAVKTREKNNSNTYRFHLWGESKIFKGLFQHDFVFANQTGSFPGPTNGAAGEKKYDAGLASINYRQTLGPRTGGNISLSYLGADYGSKSESDSKFSFSRNDKSTGRAFIEHEWSEKANSSFVIQGDYSEFFSDSLYTKIQGELGTTFAYQISDNLSVVPGSRYISEYGLFLYDLRLNYTSKTDAWISLSEGYRPPSLSDLYLQNSFFEGNKELTPETSRQVELGAEKKWGSDIKSFGWSYGTRASIYHIFYDDLISTQQSGSTFSSVNLGQSESFGVEVQKDITYNITTLSATFSQSESRSLVTGLDIPISPNTTYSFKLTQLWGPFSLSLKSTTWSSYLIRGGGNSQKAREEGWTVYDLNLSTFALSDFEVHTGIENIFNKSRILISGYPEPERRYFLRLRYFL